MNTDNFEQRLADGRARLIKRVTARERARRSVVATAVLLIAGTGAAALLGAQSANGQVTAAAVACYSSANLSAPHSPSVRQPGDKPTATLTSRDGTRMCGAYWAKNDVPAEGTPTASVEAVLCRLADGSIAVFPIRNQSADRQLCDDLGLTAVA